MSVQEEPANRALKREEGFTAQKVVKGLRAGPRSTHLRFNDEQQLNPVFHHGCLRLFSRTCGKLSGEVSLITFEHLAAYFIRLDRACLSRAVQPAGKLGLLLQSHTGKSCLWNGFSMGEPAIIAYGPGTEHAGLQANDSEGVYLSMSLKRLERMVGSANGELLKRAGTGCHRVSLPACFFGRLYRTLLQVKAALVHRPEMLEHVEVRRQFEASIEQSLLQIFTLDEQWSTGWQAAPTDLVSMVGRVEEFARIHPFERLTSKRVVHALNLDPRLTDRAFHTLFRESLGRYLKLLWFDHLRTTLRLGDVNAKDVRDLFGRRGIRWPSLFRWRYRRLFGETPERSFGTHAGSACSRSLTALRL